MSRLRVLVVGASIAGPTTAYWFAKAGASVTVIERFPQLRRGGQNIDIRTAGVTVMRKMEGMEAAVRAKLAPIEGISFVRTDGRSYGTIKSTGNPNQQSLVSEYEIFRGDLSQILYDMTKSNEHIKYVFNEQVVSIQQHGQNNGPVTVEFANGHPTSQYDLVVACDGASSRTRALGLGCGVRDYVHPTNAWAAYFTIQQDILEGTRIGQGYSAPGGKSIALGLDSSGRNRAVLISVHPRNDLNSIQPFREASKEGEDAVKRFVARRYKGAGWKCDEVMSGIMDVQDFYSTEIVQVKSPTLYKGRFVLVGDAGYAPGPTGFGTSLALTGAYVLAGEIRKHEGDLAAGLRGYEQTMRPLINDMQKIPPHILTVIAPQTALGIWLRNNIFAFICWAGILDFTQRFFGAGFANIDKHKVPDYEW